MKTQHFTQDKLDQAAALLRQGHLVAFPTETVYGLGALAHDDQAIRQVFQVKGRPSDNPLIVHVSHPDQVAQIVTHILPMAQKLMEHFWPGPLTLILPVQEDQVSSLARNGLDTVGVRMPDNALTLALIDKVGAPLVGPSANLSGRPSPTHYQHVLDDLEGKISGVVQDSQVPRVGVESTVVFPTTEALYIYRPGFYDQETLQAVVDVPVIELSADKQVENGQLMSPGVKYKHYTPTSSVKAFSGDLALEDLLAHIRGEKGKVGLLADELWLEKCHDQVSASYSLGPLGDMASATRQLFAGLRALESQGMDVIYAQTFNDSRAHAYMDRLLRASDFVI